MLYFAYGSNLNIPQMSRRCPEAAGVSAAILKGWKLHARYYADIEQAENECVYGALYSISDNDLEALDYYEGYPEYYTREIVTVESVSGKKCEAWVYTMTDEYKDARNDAPYSASYRQICSEGAKMWNIPDAFGE